MQHLACRLIQILLAIVCLTPLALQADNAVKVYRVTATSLRLRELPSGKSSVVGALPKGTLIATADVARNRETISGISGSWINIFQHSWGAYAFDAFLAEDNSLHFVDIAGCTQETQAFNCNGTRYSYDAKTGFAGAAHAPPFECAPSVFYFADNNPSRLATILKVGGGSLTGIADRNHRVVQFIATPDPRGGDCG